MAMDSERDRGEEKWDKKPEGLLLPELGALCPVDRHADLRSAGQSRYSSWQPLALPCPEPGSGRLPHPHAP